MTDRAMITTVVEDFGDREAYYEKVRAAGADAEIQRVHEADAEVRTVRVPKATIYSIAQALGYTDTGQLWAEDMVSFVDGDDTTVEVSYRVVDLRGKIAGNPVANQGTQKKTDGSVIHYNGPATGVPSGRVTPVALLDADARYHMGKDWGGGARANGIQYHESVWEDVNYKLRNPDSILWHCGGWPENASCRAYNIPIGEGERATAKTILTLAARVTEDNASQGEGPESTWGHQEVGNPTACPGNLMGDFVYPLRRGTLRVEPHPGEFNVPRFTLCAYTPETTKLAGAIVTALREQRVGKKVVQWTGKKDKINYASGVSYTSPAGIEKQYVIVLDEKAAGHLDRRAADADLLDKPITETGHWNAIGGGKLNDAIRHLSTLVDFDLDVFHERLDELMGGGSAPPEDDYEKGTPRANYPGGFDPKARVVFTETDAAAGTADLGVYVPKAPAR